MTVQPQDLLDLFRGHLHKSYITHTCSAGYGPVVANIWAEYVECRLCQKKVSRKDLVLATHAGPHSQEHLDLSQFTLHFVSDITTG